jgi:hypothetical protein
MFDLGLCVMRTCVLVVASHPTVSSIDWTIVYRTYQIQNDDKTKPNHTIEKTNQALGFQIQTNSAKSYHRLHRQTSIVLYFKNNTEICMSWYHAYNPVGNPTLLYPFSRQLTIICIVFEQDP